MFQPTQFVIWGGNPPIPAGQPANIRIGQDYMFVWAFAPNLREGQPIS